MLIIGILAAIALPQYTKAVERSRMAEAVQVLGDLGTAQSVYYMQHNTFANGWTGAGSITSGDIDMADPSAVGKWDYTVTGTNTLATMLATRNAGMYNGAALRLTVRTDGSILKECLPNGHDDFCTMAETAGYSPALGAEELSTTGGEVEECATDPC